MKIHFIFLGDKWSAEARQLGEYYIQKVSLTNDTTVRFVKNIDNISFDKKDVLICFDEQGKNISSPEFAHILETIEVDGKRACICVGEAYGIPETLKKQASLSISFSKMVFPHELARIMALEQTFRARSITRGSKYHHGD